MRVGIIGTGWIAEKAAITLNGLDNCEAYAVGSRRRETAEAFAKRASNASLTNNFFRDFYKVLIKDTNHANWFNG